MGCFIQLVRLDDTSGDIDSIDFSANGYSLAVDGYFPAVAPIGAKFVEEVITLKLQGTSKNDLAAMTQEINEKVKQVEWWIAGGPAERYQVWIRVQQENETYPRQAQLLNIVPPDKVRLFTPEEISDNYIGAYSIGIRRTPFWEDLTPTTTGSPLSITGNIGGIVQWGSTVVGDVPARLQELTLGVTMGSSALPAQAWIGFKSNRFGNATNFVPYWALSLAAYKSADTTTSTDGNGRNIVQCSFSTSATMTKRAMLQVNDVAPSFPNDQRGEYTVLLAAKVDSGSTCMTRIAFSNGPISNFVSPIYRSFVPFTETSWITKEMGTISIPASYMRQAAPEDYGRFSLSLEASRTVGSGKLYAYGFFLIPTEGMIRVRNAGYGYSGVGAPPYGYIGNPVTIFQRPDNNLVAHEYVTNYPAADYVMSPINWGLPANDDKPWVVVALDRGYGVASNNTLSIAYKYHKRWRTLRGNE